MTRSKIRDEQRRRVKEACCACKRRKQKCDTAKPCSACIKRNLVCSYTPSETHESDSPDHTGRPAKRRHVDNSSESHNSLATSGDSSPDVSDKQQEVDSLVDLDTRSPQSIVSLPDHEAAVYGHTRMLQDPTGRLLYVGDSATLSFLQMIRMVVSNGEKKSAFTEDPSRHKIAEATIMMPDSCQPPHPPPDRETANVLVESYFINTHGLLEIFDQQKFQYILDAYYSNPKDIRKSDLCLIYLVLSIGLVMVTPIADSPEERLISNLQSDPLELAEMYFRSAKLVGDTEAGIEDADLWSVRALALMSIYNLAVSKRNAAYAYNGMAVRSGYALGLHRLGETPCVFSNEEEALRRNIWRSLFVMDRFLAASLGRPTAISEDDCAADSLDLPMQPSDDEDPPNEQSPITDELDAAVQVCRVIGNTLKRVYSRRIMSTKVAQELAEDYNKWKQRVHLTLSAHGVLKSGKVPSQVIAILHVQLFGYHSVLLFTRPFFLELLMNMHGDKDGKKRESRDPNSRAEKFSKTCLSASNQTIALVQGAYAAGYLPRRNPFMMYFLFAAALVVLSNEFFSLYSNPSYKQSTSSAMSIVTYWAKWDIQARRLQFILTTFQQVVKTQNPSSSYTQGLGENSFKALMTNFSPQNSSCLSSPAGTSPQVDTVKGLSNISQAGAAASPLSTPTSLSQTTIGGLHGHRILPTRND